MQKTVFWGLMMVLGLIADMVFSLTWSIILSIPIIIVSWWIAYRSGYFD